MATDTPMMGTSISRALPWVLALPACLMGENVVRYTGDLPVDLSSISSALWFEDSYSDPEHGEGAGYLVLSGEALNCESVGYGLFYGYEQPSFMTNGSGLVVMFSWYHEKEENAGWEGQYIVGGAIVSDDGDLERNAMLVLYGNGLVFVDGGNSGLATIDASSDAAVSGTMDLDTLKAKFTAENCGKLTDEHDSYYTMDSE